MTTVLSTNPIKSYLDNLKVRTFSEAGTITDIKEILKLSGDVCVASSKLFRDLLSVEKRFDDELYARTCVGYLIKRLFHSGFYVDGTVEDLVLDACFDAQLFIDKPEWSFLKAEDGLDENGEVKISNKPIEVKQTFVEGIEAKVVVHASGKIKKGGKQVLAKEMYQRNVIENGMVNKEFVQLLIKELDMTLQGANTYAYNMRKAYEKDQALLIVE
jgi:hypothetical protein